MLSKSTFKEIKDSDLGAAWVGADQFLKLIPDAYYYNDREGYFSVTAYLNNRLIQVLLAEVTARQEVLTSA